MASVQGIGGVFIESMDARWLAIWYQEVLGITMEAHPNGRDYFHVFNTRDAVSGILRENPVFAIYQAKEALAEQGRGFTLNLRVDDLDGFLEKLRAKGVEVDGEVLVWERGKHAWVRDGETGTKGHLYHNIEFFNRSHRLCLKY